MAGNGAATDNAVSALGKLCDFHAERFTSSRVVIEQHWLPRLPLIVDEEESITVTNHLCTMLENAQRASLVLGSNYESLGRVLHVLTTVITSDRKEGICNKSLKARIQTLVSFSFFFFLKTFFDFFLTFFFSLFFFLVARNEKWFTGTSTSKCCRTVSTTNATSLYATIVFLSSKYGI